MITITTKNIIELQDWDDLVEETYGKPYSFQQQEGCRDRGFYKLTVPDFHGDYKNNTIPEVINGDEMGVSFESWLARDPKQPLKPYQDKIKTEQWAIGLWWYRNFYPDINVIANDLHAKGLLPAGDYLINIDW